MRILLTGRAGQVGSALERALAPLGEVCAFDRQGFDLLRPVEFRKAIGELNPAAIVNAAAYTAVDRAESEADLAFKVNSAAVGGLALAARSIGALLVHFSTDYVFDGEKASPYVESDAPNPLNVYGRSKLEGERAIAASGCRHLVFRTSWVYAPSGRNFLRSILAAARTQPELRVVDDQHGAPTSSLDIAAAVARILAAPDLAQKGGFYHMTAGGETTWHGFARAILDAKGIRTPLVAIPSSEYSTAARRPRNSRLSSAKLAADFGVVLPDWREGLAAVLRAVD
ncbi:MAG TPA: dTDP-4-dehydrorhamnose reductase [Burkholderiales bacterium]|nr:dTDP-4-dehydrorhamnose reductase [Burkholderiales bacterium]